MVHFFCGNTKYILVKCLVVKYTYTRIIEPELIALSPVARIEHNIVPRVIEAGLVTTDLSVLRIHPVLRTHGNYIQLPDPNTDIGL